MFDEGTLERVTMEMLHELEYEVINGYELVRTDFSKVLLEEDIIQAIERINKGIKDDQVKEALRLIRNLDHNNTILNKYRFSKNDNDSYDYERYVNFKITFNYISSVDAVEVLVMQDSSYNIAMSPFDFLIFKYEFLSHEGSSTTDKDKMNN